jgi:hypothetical protein
MSEETTPDEVLKLVEKAQSKGVFDIAAFAKGRALPQDTVTAYLNVDAAYRLDKLNKEMSLLLDAKELELLEAQAKEIAAEVIASKVIFHMRGVTQAEVEAISAKCTKDHPAEQDAFGNKVNTNDWLKAWTIALVAANIVRVENADGDVDERIFEAEDAKKLYDTFPKEVWDLLVEKMEQLTLASAYFKGLTDAGFLPKS